MKYLPNIQSLGSDPQKLEELYHTAAKAGKEADFQRDLLACYEAEPTNPIYNAWYYRFLYARKEGRSINWKLAVPLGFLLGLVFWAISGDNMVLVRQLPYLFLLCAPLAALAVMFFLAQTSGQGYRRYLLIAAFLAVVSVYVILLVPGMQPKYYEHISVVMVLHLPLLAWAGTGILVLGLRSAAEERFAFLMRSVEVFITGGLYLMAGAAFTAITFGMFAALGIQLPDMVMRMFAAGGLGLVTVIAVASVYDPLVMPYAQDFRQGLSRFIANMMRLMLPLVLAVLVVYTVTIPFNFMEPFYNRDALIVFNAMLFAVMGMLLGATPIRAEDVSPRLQSALRAGILATAGLALLVSLYALAAIIFRTTSEGLTVNRTVIIGWNSLNIALLVYLLFKQLRLGVRLNHAAEGWVPALHQVFSIAAVGYTVWAAVLVIALPLMFR